MKKKIFALITVWLTIALVISIGPTLAQDDKLVVVGCSVRIADSRW